MAEKHLTDGTTALAAQPRVIKIEAAEKPRNAQLRVAAYTRVSSDSDDQLNSFAAQNRYYAELISGKAEWRMVDIYADEGITGTSAAKREDFQRMMTDCRRGLIDQILVKSISRFARNTKDCLEAVRELKELGVNVRFEREGITRLAHTAFTVNERTENIGARRLSTVMERLLDEVSFDAVKHQGQTIVIDAAYVDARLEQLSKDEDLSRYIL